MTTDTFDTILSIVDIVICIVDISLIVYLFFWRLPLKPTPKFTKFGKRKQFKRRVIK